MPSYQIPQVLHPELVDWNAIVKYSRKMLDFLHVCKSKRVEVLVSEGTIRASKTVVNIEGFYYRVKSQNGGLACIACKDLNAIRDNILDTEVVGLMKRFKDVTLRKEKIGGYFCQVRGYDGKLKKILLAGYADVSKWKNILGKTIETFLIDEVNLASEQFLDEAFARQASCDNPLMMMTLNGDVPNHYVYQKYINRCNIIGSCPPSTRGDMAKFDKKANWYYMHFTFSDNPIMTPEKIERTYTLYPKGSYYYKIKILGERGVAEGLIHEALAQEPDKFRIKKEDVPRLAMINIGVDFGGNKSYNAFVATGFSIGFKKTIYLKSARPESKGVNVDKLCEQFEKFVRDVLNEYPYIGAINVYCDSAEQTIINQFRTISMMRRLPVQIHNSLKLPIVDRIRLVDLMIAKQDAIKFVIGEAESVFDAFASCRWDDDSNKQNQRLDNGTTDIDSVDAGEYTIEPMRNTLLPLLENVERSYLQC